MNYCLSVEELAQLIDRYTKSRDIEDMNLSSLVENARQWDTKLICLSVLFARLLERENKDTAVPTQMIKTLFSLKEKIYLEIQHCDLDFIEYMLGYSHSRNTKDTLEDILIDIQNGIGDRRYVHALRY